jgi:hypothetical protein
MPIDMQTFIKNRQAFPLEELAKYAGQWVAWGPDGTKILASSSESEAAVYDLLKQEGHDLSECCLSYVPGPDEIILGGLSLPKVN